MLMHVRPMAIHSNPDALEDDEWWLDEEELLAKGRGKRSRDRSESERDVKKRKRKRISEILASEEEEPFEALHTTQRQCVELTQALVPKLKKLFTAVESDEVQLKAKHFSRVTCQQQYRSPMTMSAFLLGVCPKWDQWLSSCCEAMGSPVVVIITGSALRATELKREVEGFCSRGCVAKLFSRHMKVEEQAAFLGSHLTPVAIATPRRLHKLLDAGHLNTSCLKRVVFDWFWRDKKLKRMRDVVQVWTDFTRLYHSHLNHFVLHNKTKLVLY